MIRALYSCLFYGAQPLIWARLLWRARHQPDYLRHIGERYGHFAPHPPSPLIWLHVVSVGETRAAEPLIKALLDAYPEHALLLTHMTPTGRATGAELIAKLRPFFGNRLLQTYLPYDIPGATQRFLDHFRPSLGLLMETELWPNLIAAAQARQIPLALVNARLSERSMRGYQRITALIRPAIGALSAVIAQTAADAARLQTIGATAVTVSGNIKFDVEPSAEKRALGATWRQTLGQRKVWLAASTREGEEALILDAYQHLADQDILLLLVPRHPQRFDEVAALVAQRGLPLQRRSQNDAPPGNNTQVWLGDSMGEMPAYFSTADIALIGGTLLPFGGQNLIEAAACSCPVLVGPHTFNFAQATQDALACGAAHNIVDAESAARETVRLLEQPQQLAAMKQAALDFSQAHRGATARTMSAIRALTVVPAQTAD